jgi:predicted pyridoxine 5'-phosphate oxidase superfamily flavin-nucleotide-binding protein
MNLITIPSEAKVIIEQNPVAIATITEKCMPNVIGVACVQVISNNQLLVTDVYMNQTLKDISANPKVAVVAWNKDMVGYKLLGEARYYNSGNYFEKVKLAPENKDLKPKGAIVITISRIIKSS